MGYLSDDDLRERAEPLLDLRDVAVVRRQCVILIIARVIVQRGLHPEVVVSDTFALADASEAYALADAGVSGKVGIVW